MKYDFDTVYDRKNTNSLKYDFTRERGKSEDLLPMWVADMDFKVLPEVEQKLINCVRHGIFGYSEAKESYFEAIRDWFKGGFGYNPKPEWLVKTPGVVFALATAVKAYTNEGDSVLIQCPVYYPFGGVIRDNNRKIINNPLVYENGAYHIDFPDFEQKIAENNVRLFILCSPHNPVGRVWTKEELEKMGDICTRYNCVIASDEIHCDFVYEPNKHSVFSVVKPEFEQNSVILTAPSKTFNLAGLQISNVFIANPELHEKFTCEYDKTGYSQLNTVGLVACEAAYRYGREWLNELKQYLSENISLVRDFTKRNPHIRLIEPQGTYLVWLDFSAFGEDKEIEDLIEKKAGLWLDGGLMFGKEGTGFQRINIACPREILECALLKLEIVLNKNYKAN